MKHTTLLSSLASLLTIMSIMAPPPLPPSGPPPSLDLGGKAGAPPAPALSSALLAGIKAGTSLKKVETVDKSGVPGAGKVGDAAPASPKKTGSAHVSPTSPPKSLAVVHHPAPATGSITEQLARLADALKVLAPHGGPAHGGHVPAHDAGASAAHIAQLEAQLATKQEQIGKLKMDINGPWSKLKKDIIALQEKIKEAQEGPKKPVVTHAPASKPADTGIDYVNIVQMLNAINTKKEDPAQRIEAYFKITEAAQEKDQQLASENKKQLDEAQADFAAIPEKETESRKAQLGIISALHTEKVRIDTAIINRQKRLALRPTIEKLWNNASIKALLQHGPLKADQKPTQAAIDAALK